MNTKAIGEITEAKVIARLLELGYSVSVPFGNNQRYDLIVDDGKTLIKAQVKTGRYRDGCVIFNTVSVNGFTKKSKSYNGFADIFLVYCQEVDEFYIIPVDDAAKSSMYLRVEDTKNCVSTVNWAEDYTLGGHIWM